MKRQNFPPISVFWNYVLDSVNQGINLRLHLLLNNIMASQYIVYRIPKVFAVGLLPFFRLVIQWFIVQQSHAGGDVACNSGADMKPYLRVMLLQCFV